MSLIWKWSPWHLLPSLTMLEFVLLSSVSHCSIALTVTRYISRIGLCSKAVGIDYFYKPGGLKQRSAEWMAKPTSSHRSSLHQKAPGHDRTSSSSASTRTSQNRSQLEEIEICTRGISKLWIGETGLEEKINNTPIYPGEQTKWKKRRNFRDTISSMIASEDVEICLIFLVCYFEIHSRNVVKTLPLERVVISILLFKKFRCVCFVHNEGSPYSECCPAKFSPFPLRLFDIEF